MARYRNDLPQLGGDLFLTDGGVETTLYFKNGFEFPEMAAFHLLANAEGERAIRDLYRAYVNVAREHRVGALLESITWRASADWGAKLGYGDEALAAANRRAVTLLHEIRDELENDATRIVVSGCLGPRGDGYDASVRMTQDESAAYHASQIATLADADADMIGALTLNYTDEAIGIVRAAAARDMPCAVSFTVETDGRLPSGETMKDAIEQVDAATDAGPAYYMINCAHPTHFDDALAAGESWVSRIRGLRPNASAKSHAELDESPELDEGDAAELGAQCAELKRRLAHVNVIGGCCGTDHNHVDHIARACAPLFD